MFGAGATKSSMLNLSVVWLSSRPSPMRLGQLGAPLLTVLQKDRKRASGRRRDDAGGLPPAQNEAQRPVVQPAFAFAERGLVDAAENDAMLTSMRTGRVRL